jgi:hypothetical protein
MKQSRNKASVGSVSGAGGWVCCRVDSGACIRGRQAGRAQWRPSRPEAPFGEMHVFAGARSRSRRAREGRETKGASMGVTEPGGTA